MDAVSINNTRCFNASVEWQRVQRGVRAMSAGSNAKGAVKPLQWQLLSPSHKPGDLTNAWRLRLLMTHQQDEVCTHKTTHTHMSKHANSQTNMHGSGHSRVSLVPPVLFYAICQCRKAGRDTKTWMDGVKPGGAYS